MCICSVSFLLFVRCVAPRAARQTWPNSSSLSESWHSSLNFVTDKEKKVFFKKKWLLEYVLVNMFCRFSWHIHRLIHAGVYVQAHAFISVIFKLQRWDLSFIGRADFWMCIVVLNIWKFDYHNERVISLQSIFSGKNTHQCVPHQVHFVVTFQRWVTTTVSSCNKKPILMFSVGHLKSVNLYPSLVPTNFQSANVLFSFWIPNANKHFSFAFSIEQHVFPFQWLLRKKSTDLDTY